MAGKRCLSSALLSDVKRIGVGEVKIRNVVVRKDMQRHRHDRTGLIGWPGAFQYLRTFRFLPEQDVFNRDSKPRCNVLALNSKVPYW